MQGCSINDERCYASGGSNLEAVTQQQSQALNQEGHAGTSGARDDKPQWIGAFGCKMSLYYGVHIKLCFLHAVWVSI